MGAWLSILAALAAALRELFRLIARAAERRANREDAERDAGAAAYDRLARAMRARKAVREKLAASRATARKPESDVSIESEDGAGPGDGGNASAGPASDDGLPDDPVSDRYRRD